MIFNNNPSDYPDEDGLYYDEEDTDLEQAEADRYDEQRDDKY